MNLTNQAKRLDKTKEEFIQYIYESWYIGQKKQAKKYMQQLKKVEQKEVIQYFYKNEVYHFEDIFDFMFDTLFD